MNLEAARADRARAALAAARVGVWDWDVRTGELHWDETIAELHGVDPAHFDGSMEMFLSRVHPDDRASLQAGIQATLTRGGEFLAEFRVLRPDGSTAWVQGRGAAILDDDGAPLRMTGLGMDTTKLFTERERAGRSIEQVSDGVAMVDAAWTVRYVNLEAARLVGLDPSDVVGRNLWDVFREAEGTVFSERFEEALREQRPVRFEAYYGPLDGWFELRVFAGPDGLTIFFRNIDEQRAAEVERSGFVSRLEVSVQRAEQLLALTTALANALTLDDVASAVLHHTEDAFGTLFAGVALFDDAAETLRFVSLEPLPEETVKEWTEVPMTVPIPMTDAVRERRSLFHESRAVLLARYPHLAATVETAGNHAFASLPLVSRGRVIGALSVSWAHPREFSVEDRQYLATIAGQCAQAVERSRLFQRERTIAQTLQHAILPERLPETAELEIAAQYLPAETNVVVGGDWYDAFVVPDGSIALAVGDVAGHGLPAAAMMAQLRNMLRAYALELIGPAEVLRRLDQIVAEPAGGFATCVLAVFDPTTRSLTWSSAGHPPVALRRPDGTTAFLGGEPGPPLGAGAPFPEHRVTVEAGTSLILYTDGLVETRRQSLQVGLDALLGALGATGVDDDIADVCDGVIRMLGDASKREDDVCALAVRVPT